MRTFNWVSSVIVKRSCQVSVASTYSDQMVGTDIGLACNQPKWKSGQDSLNYVCIPLLVINKEVIKAPMPKPKSNFDLE